MEKQFVQFTGNCPSNVNKDAKYTVRLEKGEYVVGIYYVSSDGELWYPSSGDHPGLVEMVNDVKKYYSGSPGGAFYINEYKQVIVPVQGEESDYYFAGEYNNPLEFEFEGKKISGDAKDLDGKKIHPGDVWVGPHPGIPYVLKAGGKDIQYEYWVRPKVKKRVRLSDHVDNKTAEIIARDIAQIKGAAGGRFYVNEFCQMFAPKGSSGILEYVYIGKIEDLSNWFPKPEISI
jgi:hypothetical protein